MKKKETILYEVTPDEVAKLPKSSQVLRLDVLTGLYSLIHGGRRPLECWCIKFYIFKLTGNDKELIASAGSAAQ